jgi:ElaB/YqjD/DUF883 family membrane-anchored ribosome-binding protein
MAKSVAELRRECEQARSDLASTVAELKLRAASASDDFKHRVSPEGVKSELRQKSYEWGDALRRYVESNPLQSIAAAVAIAYPAVRLV